jgi:hypothetical protein
MVGASYVKAAALAVVVPAGAAANKPNIVTKTTTITVP